jgi:hypothetical protein
MNGKLLTTAVILFLMSSLQGHCNSGCEPPILNTSNGISYYMHHGTGQKRSYRKGDCILFHIKVRCNSLTDSIRIKRNDTLIYSALSVRDHTVRLVVKPGHYEITSRWYYNIELVKWKFELEELPYEKKANTVQTDTSQQTGLPEAVYSAFRFYPQPASHFVIPDGSELLEQIEIIDISGKRLIHVQNPRLREAIPLSQLSKGVFILIATTTEKKVYRKKLVVN